MWEDRTNGNIRLPQIGDNALLLTKRIWHHRIADDLLPNALKDKPGDDEEENC